MTLRGGISMAQKMGLLMSVLFVDLMVEGVCRVPSMLNERTQMWNHPAGSPELFMPGSHHGSLPNTVHDSWAEDLNI